MIVLLKDGIKQRIITVHALITVKKILQLKYFREEFKYLQSNEDFLLNFKRINKQNLFRINTAYYLETCLKQGRNFFSISLL